MHALLLYDKAVQGVWPNSLRHNYRASGRGRLLYQGVWPNKLQMSDCGVWANQLTSAPRSQLTTAWLIKAFYF